MFNKLAKEVHENAVNHGFWEDKKSFRDIVALCHTELSEAFEEHRNGHKSTEIYYTYSHCSNNFRPITCNGLGVNCDTCGHGKPEGIPIELADCIIRILDYCGHEGIDIEEAIRIKHEYNKTRPYKHGGKKL